MSSRKKAKGQARKAEKERQAREQARAQQRASCKHFTPPENAMQDDIDDAYSLLIEYVNGLNAIQDGDLHEPILKLVEETYIKYFQYSDVRKQVFQNLILAQGTANCVDEANENRGCIGKMAKIFFPSNSHEIWGYHRDSTPCEHSKF
jgi:hypothetical protein